MIPLGAPQAHDIHTLDIPKVFFLSQKKNAKHMSFAFFSFFGIVSDCSENASGLSAYSGPFLSLFPSIFGSPRIVFRHRKMPKHVLRASIVHWKGISEVSWPLFLHTTAFWNQDFPLDFLGICCFCVQCKENLVKYVISCFAARTLLELL